MGDDAFAEVDTADRPLGHAGLQVTRDDVVAHELPPDVVDPTQPLGPFAATDAPDVLSDPVFAPLVGSCLTARGWNVVTRGDGTVGLHFPLAQSLGSEFVADVDDCAAEAGYR